MTQSEDRSMAKAFGSNLQAARKAAGYKSAKAFATKNGFNPGTYTAHEQGQRNMTLEQAWQYADKLGCSLDAIVGARTPIAYDDPAKAELNDCYDACSPERRERLLDAARDAKALSS